MSLLLTGASGFIGSNFIKQYKAKIDIYGVVRNSYEIDGLKDILQVKYLNGSTDWSDKFLNIQTVLHLAGIAHSKSVSNIDYQNVNVAGTLHLATEAVKAGVKRFIFVSSIGVNGNSTSDIPFSNISESAPHNYYTHSKYDAEVGLKKIAAETGLELIIVRPTLVYGPNAPGSFGLLTKLITRFPVMPFGLVNNKRDFIAIQNLVDLLFICTVHPNAAGHTFLASDGETVSIKKFTNAIAKGVGTNLLQLPIPTNLIRFAGRVIGKPMMIEQLVGNLAVESNYLKEILNWSPPYTMEEAMTFLKQDN